MFILNKVVLESVIIKVSSVGLWYLLILNVFCKYIINVLSSVKLVSMVEIGLGSVRKRLMIRVVKIFVNK